MTHPTSRGLGTQHGTSILNDSARWPQKPARSQCRVFSAHLMGNGCYTLPILLGRMNIHTKNGSG